MIVDWYDLKRFPEHSLNSDQYVYANQGLPITLTLNSTSQGCRITTLIRKSMPHVYIQYNDFLTGLLLNWVKSVKNLFSFYFTKLLADYWKLLHCYDLETKYNFLASFSGESGTWRDKKAGTWLKGTEYNSWMLKLWLSI